MSRTSRSSRRWTGAWWARHRVVIPICLFFIVIGTAVLALAKAYGGPDSGKASFQHEVMATSVQVLGVVTLGALVTVATTQFQQIAEARRRLDGRVADFLRELSSAYNGVKGVRRQLEARTRSARGHQAAIDRATYVDLMTDLMRWQLVFEDLSDRARSLQERVKPARDITVGDGPTKEASPARPEDAAWDPDMEVGPVHGDASVLLEVVEEQLNILCEEYQKNLSRVPASGSLPLDQLTGDGQGHPRPQLPVFIESTPCFKACVHRYVRAVQQRLEEHLLRR